MFASVSVTKHYSNFNSDSSSAPVNAFPR